MFLAGAVGGVVVPTEKKMPLEREPMRAGEIVGHRVWEVHRRDGVPTLRSWAYTCFWPPGGYISDMSYVSESVNSPIDEHNQRGVWAFKTRDLLHEDFRKYQLVRPTIYGTCYMWGTIIEHEYGYRSKYARVLSLEFISDGIGLDNAWAYETPVPRADIDLDELRKRYGVS